MVIAPRNRIFGFQFLEYIPDPVSLVAQGGVRCFHSCYQVFETPDERRLATGKVAVRYLQIFRCFGVGYSISDCSCFDEVIPALLVYRYHLPVTYSLAQSSKKFDCSQGRDEFGVAGEFAV